MSKEYYAERRFQSKDLTAVLDATLGEVLYINSYKSFGTVRYVGTTDFASGVWVGLELYSPIGKNDGTVKGKRYFPCQPQYGIFVRMTACSRVREDNLDDSGDYSAGNTPPLRSLGRSSVVGRDSTIASISAKPGGFKTPNKTAPNPTIADTPDAARLNRPFLSRATRESLLGNSKDNIKRSSTARETSRQSMASVASRTVGSSRASMKPATSPVAGKTPTRSRSSHAGTSSRASTGVARTPVVSRSSSRVDTSKTEETIDELKSRIVSLEDNMKKISDIILDGVQAIVSNHAVAPDAELTSEEVQTLKTSLAAVSEIAQQAHEAVLEERERHARELVALKNAGQRISA